MKEYSIFSKLGLEFLTSAANAVGVKPNREMGQVKTFKRDLFPLTKISNY